MTIDQFLKYEHFGEKIAFVEQTPYRSHSFTYADVAYRMKRAAAGLHAKGVRAGDRVILWGANNARWAITFYGCVLLGAVVVPIDASFSQSFVDRIREQTKAKLVLQDSDSAMWDSLLSTTSLFRQFARVPPDALLEIIYTSGTTGDPKGVMITHGNLLSNLEPVRHEVQKYRKYAIPFQPLGFVHLIPLSHLFGQIMGLFIPQILAGKVIFSDPAPSNVIRSVKLQRASAIICVPHELSLLRSYVSAKFESVLNDPEVRPDKVWQRWWRYRSVHREFGWKFWAFICGGASLPKEEEEFWSRLGYAVIQGYGLTETAPSVTITHPFKGIRRGSVGKKLPGLEIKIAEDGEILVRGGNVSPGYYQNEEATREVFRDGWLYTGDIGKFDDAGNLIIRGRKKEMIVAANGLNVYPQDVEAALQEDARVKEVAVVARDHNGRAGIHAVFVLQENVSFEEIPEIVGCANAMLEAHQRVRSFSLWPGSYLPRTSTGKLMRNAIAKGTPVSAMADRKTGDLLERVLAGGSERLEEDLGLSSLDRVELMMELEQRTGTPLEDSAFANARTASDVAALLQAPSQEKAAAYPIRKWTTYRPVEWLRVGSWYLLAYPAMALRGVQVRSEGRQNLERLNPPVLFVANHQSVLDVPAIVKSLPFRLRRKLAPAMGIGRSNFQNLTASFFFNTYLLPGTSAGLRQALQHTGELADRGYCPLVFPEGVRTPDGRLLPFRPGIGVIVARTHLPVVPIFVQGAFEAWPTGARRPRPGTITITFGAPIHFTYQSPSEIVASLESLYR